MPLTVARLLPSAWADPIQAGMAAKCATAPGAKDYCFKTRSGLLLDPTDASGQLSNHPAPGLPWLPTDFTLACINEPPRGVGGTSVTVRGGT